MPLKGISKPNLNSNLKTGFRLMGRTVARGASVQKPSVKAGIASNHPIAVVGSKLGGKKKGRMY